MLYAYRKDLKAVRQHFPKSYLLIVTILLIFSGLFLVIKVKSCFFK